jgi:hypothetical protein
MDDMGLQTVEDDVLGGCWQKKDDERWEEEEKEEGIAEQTKGFAGSVCVCVCVDLIWRKEEHSQQ